MLRRQVCHLPSFTVLSRFENGFLLCFKASLDSYRTTDHHALLRHIDSLLNGIKESHFCGRFQSYLGCRNLKDGERGQKKRAGTDPLEAYNIQFGHLEMDEVMVNFSRYFIWMGSLEGFVLLSSNSGTDVDTLSIYIYIFRLSMRPLDVNRACNFSLPAGIMFLFRLDDLYLRNYLIAFVICTCGVLDGLWAIAKRPVMKRRHFLLETTSNYFYYNSTVLEPN